MGGYADIPGNIASALRAFDQRVQTTRDANRAQDLVSHATPGNLRAAGRIIEANPNIGILVDGVALWGEFGGAFLDGYANGMRSTNSMLASNDLWRSLDLGMRILVQLGWRAVAEKLSGIRSPDFKVLNVQIVAGVGRFIARGDDMSTALHGITGGNGAELSFAVGWMIQRATPRHEDIVNWGNGLDFSASGFALVGGGIIFSPQQPSVPGVYLGVGAGGKGIGGSFSYKPW
jgi:hypothetical protein